MTNKLPYQSTFYVFLSYTLHRGYLYLKIQTQHFHISCHVLFHEDQFPFQSISSPPLAPFPTYPLKLIPFSSPCPYCPLTYINTPPSITSLDSTSIPPAIQVPFRSFSFHGPLNHDRTLFNTLT